MFRTLGVLTLLLIATATSGQAAQEPFAAAARPASVSAPEAFDLSGSWVGMIAIPEKDRRTPSSFHAVLKQNGGALSGTAGPNTKSQTALTKGRVESTRFGTSLIFNLPGPNIELEFQLRVSDGMLKGVARLPGVAATAPVELHRIDPNPRAKAPNMSGTWIGTFALANTERSLHIVLQQSGASISGTAGPHGSKQMPISEGKVATTEAGTSVSFQMDAGTEEVVMLFELALTDAGLKGTITISQKGEKVSGPVELTPVK